MSVIDEIGHFSTCRLVYAFDDSGRANMLVSRRQSFVNGQLVYCTVYSYRWYDVMKFVTHVGLCCTFLNIISKPLYHRTYFTSLEKRHIGCTDVISFKTRARNASLNSVNIYLCKIALTRFLTNLWYSVILNISVSSTNKYNR